MLARRLLIAGGSGSFTPPPPAAGPPNEATWARYSGNPVLSPTGGQWTEGAVDGPSVLYNGGWLGWFAGSATSGTFLGAMDSSDGLAWTDHLTGGVDVPVLGGSHGGITGSVFQPNVQLFGSTYYCYYNDPANSYGLSVATSSDGLTWTVAATNILSFASGFDQWNTASIVKIGPTYHMLVEGRHGSIFETCYATSSTLTSGWSLGNGGAPLTDLQIAAGGMYGGPILTVMSDGLVHNYYHAAPGSGSLPTNIYTATCDPSDFTSWTPSATSPILTHSGSGDEVDQLADPCVVLVGSTWYLYCAAVWNQSPFQSDIILATAAAT